MRDRLIGALVGMTIAVVVLFSVPRAYLVADLVERQEERKIERSADLIAILVAERQSDAQPLTSEFLEQTLNRAEYVEYVAPDGSTVSAGEPPPGDDSDITVTQELPDGGELTVARSGTLVEERVSDALLPLVVVSLSLTVLAVVVGYFLARRMARPFTELARKADQLGEGRFDLDVPHYRVPEAEHIGTALRGAAAQLDDLVRREREFAVNASHQLRTPITALRLEIEDVTLWPETPPEVADHLHGVLGELDRLSAAITELLDVARGKRIPAAAVDLNQLIGQAVERWRTRFTAADRSVVQLDQGTIAVRVPPGPVTQILDVLLENAAVHGAGRVEVVAEDLDTHVQVRVSDEGTPTFGQEVFGRGVTSTGTGVGLAVASELAESMGGYLSLETEAPTQFVLRLPQRRRAAGRRDRG